MIESTKRMQVHAGKDLIMDTINQMGTKIAELRRSHGFTQEDLAERLGVSAQAVSKWETGAGFPDITTLPVLADIFNISVDELFGRNPKAADCVSEDFPPTYRDTPFAANYRNIACYTSMEVSHQDGPDLTFEDGSTANLATGMIHNVGNQQIFIYYLREASTEDKEIAESVSEEQELQKKEACEEEPVHSFDIVMRGPADIKLLYNPEISKLRWRAEGPKDFLEGISVSRRGGTLYVQSEYSQERNFIGIPLRFSSDEAFIEIEIPDRQAQKLKLQIMGSGDFISDLQYETTDLRIQGSGDVMAEDIGESSISIKGSGDVKASRVHNAKIEVKGSGDITLDQAEGELALALSGASDTCIRDGRLSYLDLRISGAGDFDGRGLDVDRAAIRLSGAADVVIGRIRGESREQISSPVADLKVLKRG